MADRAKFSNYFITINSNLPNTAANRRLAADAMRAATEAVMHQLFAWVRPSAEQHRQFTRAERRLFLRLRSRVALEAGAARNASPHAHTLLEIMHQTSLWANFDDLKRIIRNNLDGMTAEQRRAVNIDVRWVRGDDVANVLHYMLKDGVDPAAVAQRQYGPDMRLGDAPDEAFPERGQYDGWDRDAGARHDREGEERI